MTITVTPISPALGAEISGINIAAGIDDDDFAGILAAWHQFGLLVLRDQNITEDQQVAFGARFGELAPWSRFADKNDEPEDNSNPYIMLISNLKENGEYIGSLAEGEIEFHSDGIYIEKPLAATMLYAVQPTLHGGETAFANMYKAYETLPRVIKAQVLGKQALHAFTYNSAVTTDNKTRKNNWDDVAHFIHPMVRTHPVTGRRALYINRLMTQEIVGMERHESDELLALLYDHMERTDFIYKHSWRKGDVLIWDNRCLTHARCDFPKAETRIMKRLTIQGERPA
ncbi:MAG: TauD/TfdA family dioxygenase [Rhodospirillales bacterium]|jgi:taurine dioxygenase|nr:TauD/TfdA family dioxygenase [Rhodospirillales bacterium]MBT4005924.1 TauD/TfdA family dioxygenase [Rhodospirillales bacterium]MBT5075093.1 TauD/TfdA family dioxygenase [Rhodospirillales bacterium]MBT5112660.1 TauD/TfdA family dioxygenase [Rhodospirillales bacterium]MBT5673429.1 TauD/TfdA family dioxygenase [Rhodospirillales bacterium]